MCSFFKKKIYILNNANSIITVSYWLYEFQPNSCDLHTSSFILWTQNSERSVKDETVLPEFFNICYTSDSN